MSDPDADEKEEVNVENNQFKSADTTIIPDRETGEECSCKNKHPKPRKPFRGVPTKRD